MVGWAACIVGLGLKAQTGQVQVIQEDINNGSKNTGGWCNRNLFGYSVDIIIACINRNTESLIWAQKLIKRFL
jgi:hypothetical protein